MFNSVQVALATRARVGKEKIGKRRNMGNVLWDVVTEHGSILLACRHMKCYRGSLWGLCVDDADVHFLHELLTTI